MKQQPSTHQPFRPKGHIFNSDGVFCAPPERVRKRYSARMLNSYSAPRLVAGGEVASRKTLRTCIRNADGTVAGGKIDLSTGEVQPHVYADIGGLPKFNVGIKDSVVPPPWLCIPPPDYVTGGAQITPRKRLKNTLKPYLMGHFDLQDAIALNPELDHWFQGALHLDLGGNTRPLNPRLVFLILQQCDPISSASVAAIVRCEMRHAQKIVQILNVIINASKRCQLKLGDEVSSYMEPN